MAAAKRGVNIELILLADEINKKSGLDFPALERAGVSVYWYSADNTGLMHHKFCIIDNYTSLTGSYNWTSRAATANRENLTVIQDAGAAKEFVKEFLYLREEVKDKKSPLDFVEGNFSSSDDETVLSAKLWEQYVYYRQLNRGN